MRGSIALGLALALVVVCVGCEVKIDASSDESLKKSVDEMSKSMDEAKAERFQKAVTTLMTSKVLWDPGLKDEASMRAKIKELFHGKTADEIIAEADKVSADAKRDIEKIMKE